ncbi:probable galacturonosyltransferase-like 3 [Physcomitrium patens]|uniref:Hexosyltransferase n=1 Tax=Physcomitrium patens TaxID=3218 RepID=A0A2K1L263_PHYPA|nr:probable galacturonosyltransferase-like 3 [Physcomitrium patens]PNR60106.1 hypothetical protein PHYPA_002899 [Physcomitrium patens]|eukprot:XP_024399370.1 probable galacturonosyltransferase-like 3 [Physcomitrella patens]
MAPSATMWRLLPPWQNLHNGAIVSIWPCMPGFHRCSLGLRTPTCMLVDQPAAPDVAEYRQSHSTQLWLTTLPLAIVVTIFLVSIAAQDFNGVDTTSQTQPQFPAYRRVHTGIPFKTRVSTSWSITTSKLGHFFDVKRFHPKSLRSNQSASTRPVKIPEYESTTGQLLGVESVGEHPHPSVQRAAKSSSRSNIGLLPDLVSYSNEGLPLAQGQRQLKNQERFTKPSSTIEQLEKSQFPRFRKAVSLPNRTCSDASQCIDSNCDNEAQGSFCNERLVHIAMTLDINYLRGSMAAIYSILRHAECSGNIRFHFVATNGKEKLEKVVAETLPFLQFQTYPFDESLVKSRISYAVRHALEEPLNYARFYLAHMIDPCVKRIIYLDSDVLVIDRIEELWMINMGNSTVGTPEYCHANFHSYFTERFWRNSSLASIFANKKPCYFNSGVMLINLDRWRKEACTATLEYWMEVQKERHIYELGSLPPLLLTFAGSIQAIDSRWNQHGLGGDILRGDCRPTRNEPASLLHWSGGGKPWQRLDIHQPCPVDSIWAQYDLLEPSG